MNELHHKLIQRDIDGDLSPEEREQLRQVLESDVEARTLHQRMSRVGMILGSIEPVNPPARIRKGVMAAIHPQAGMDSNPASDREGTADRNFDSNRKTGKEPARGAGSPRRTSWWERFFQTPSVPRYAMAMAAGVVIALVGVYGTGLDRLGPGSGSAEYATGTMLPPRSGEGWQTISTDRLGAGGLDGVVVVKRSQDLVSVELQVSGRPEAELVLASEDGALQIVRVERARADQAEVRLENDRIRISPLGQNSIQILFQGREGSESSLRLTIRDGESLLDRILPTHLVSN